jgi:PEP-CTERM motif
MKFAHVLALSCVVALAAVSAQANVITDLSIPLANDQFDSGWRAELPADQAARNITDMVFDPETHTVTISIEKDFGEYDAAGEEFPHGEITFVQTLPDAQAYTRIIVHDETIRNNTTLPWDTYAWWVYPGGAAWFNTALTSWNVSPHFNSLAWTDQVGSTAHTLLASSGTVANGDTFKPNGGQGPGLVIDVNVAGANSFVLKQIVTPEPGTISLLALAAMGLLRRKRPSVRGWKTFVPFSVG